MGQDIKLTASDGFVLDAYKAVPTTTPRGGLVVLQEIFGVNHHIRSVADRFAAEGYLVVAPAIFDRAKPGVQLNYDQDGMQEGIALNKQTKHADTMKDIAAAVAAASEAGRVGVIGYCWGGTLAYAAACDLPGVYAAVGYYGGGIVNMLDEKPTVPLMLHFGEQDDHIPMSDIEKIKAAEPSVPVFTYPAGHGFNCDERGSYDKAGADLALSRTLPFLRENVG
ncbi:dienelactone hydrolase family protein [Lichenihabitans sp. PAMC28606]|uniref:dienelactone hydrolase family protein n=1 Tax=Lichenihabitans sp. PAMC28606 TaxID=2880932 RepID=UPI001D0B9B2F|nr:dienelactone hydrolase family protein [Lichenihabitans sp. PAMC28606]UDL96388.1 dienelactone hydrolase family protein [Lichenihabitans sp. PAMC28606]